MEVGGWVRASIGIFVVENHPKNTSKPVQIFCILLKVVSYYDLSVLSMSVMGFQPKKVWMGGCGWVG